MKKSLISGLLLLAVFLLSACSGGQEYMKVEIYSAESDTLIKTIDDTKKLAEIKRNVAMGESDIAGTSKSILVGENPEYYFVFYISPDKPSGNFILTVYENSDLIFDEFPDYEGSDFNFDESSVDGADIPADYGFYRSSRVVKYLYSLI